MSAVAIALYRPHKWTDIGGRLICWWTGGEYSHVEIVVDGWCYSSSLRDGGVRRKRIDLLPPWWDVVEMPGADPQRVIDLFARSEGERYGWADLISQHVMRLPWHDASGWLCSEWAAMALGLPRPETWHPAIIGEYAKQPRT